VRPWKMVALLTLAVQGRPVSIYSYTYGRMDVTYMTRYVLLIVRQV
jgi:hypothetical protein